MDWKLKKLWPVATVTLLSMGSLFGASADMSKGEPGMATGVTAPSARAQLVDSKGFFITADVLWWKANVDGLSPVVANTITAPDATASDVHASRFFSAQFDHLKHKWDPGFKLGIGHNATHDEWDVLFNWTHFRNRASLEDEADAVPPQVQSEVLFPNWAAFRGESNFAVPIETLEVHSKWKLHLTMFDLELGRKLYLGKWMAVRPFIGARGLSLRHIFANDYYGGTAGTSTSFGVPVEIVRNSCRFRGVGIRTGLNTQWNLGEGWSFFGDTAFSLVYGNFKVWQKEFEGPSEQFEDTILNIEDNFRASRFVGDFALGFRWEKLFDSQSYNLIVSLAWEQHIFFDQNEMNRFMTRGAAATAQTGTANTFFVPDEGNITTQGFTLSVHFDF